MGSTDATDGEKGAVVNEYQAETDEEQQETKPARGLSRNFGPVALDVAIAMAAGYFVIFAALANSWDGTPVSDYKAKALLEAAKIGPTIWPILFAMIAARLVTAVARWRLENGATIGLLEYLLGSRSMSAAFMAPVKFRTVNLFVPLLLLLWAFSPAGGQSSLRIVTKVDKEIISLSTFRYLDFTTATFSISQVVAAEFISYINLVFNAALIGPADAKNATQDAYGNLHIPMLESIASIQTPTADGWYDTTTKSDLVYTSLIGTPIGDIRGNVNSSFNIETAYMYFDCSVSSKVPIAEGSNASVFPSINYRTAVIQNMGIFYSDVPNTHQADASHPRVIGFDSYVGEAGGGPVLTQAYCNVTQTYIEAQVFCDMTRSCDVQAIRESQKKHDSPNLTALDGNIPPSPAYTQTAEYFFESLVGSAQQLEAKSGKILCSNSIENYLVDPTFPINPLGCKWHKVYKIGDDLFSKRFTQLMNTYWLAGVSPSGVTGDWSSLYSYDLASAEGTTRSVIAIMRCHIPYLVILLLASLVLFVAGMLTAALDARRRGPDVLDDFVNQLRHNPYVKVNHGSSMDDGAEKSKRLRQTVVKMGDVKPDDPVGYVAIATPTAEQPVAPLQLTRHYS